MGLLSRRSNNNNGPWLPAVSKNHRWGGAAGTYSGYVNGELVTGYTTRRQARQIARREAQRRNREDRQGRS